ncbi:MAG: efflux RND transporter periplasmic adaptor subunit [Novosphingobium sp.]|nr:efflux RND transporter periplasmic adaptor subunit [Novosphingobium sp.]MBO9601550.1 efflux RND transporter periplasmic adaptor subunit [Novosphingobium sp.]
MLSLRTATLVGLSSIALALAGCSDSSKQHDKGPPTVGYVVVAPSAVPIPVSLGGRTVAFETSEVRPQVSGIIQRRLFTEGSNVRAGQPLYQIDPSLYRASALQAQANLAAARATAEAARAKANRYKPLAEQQAIAQQDYTDAEATARQAEAAVAQASAALETARINLRFATVTAPISGRIGRSLVTTGALASASQADPLAVIQRYDPMYVDMQQSSADLTALRQQLAKGQVNPGSTTVQLQLEDGTTYPLPGVVEFSDVSVSESTGTVTLRARFPNPGGLLLPGMFVNAVFEQAVQPQAYLVPQAALQRDFDGSAFVYIVGADNKAARRKVTAARTSGADWVITDGLQRGDKVITQGLGNNVRQGTALKPVPANTPQRIGVPQGAGGGKAGGKAG